MYSVCQPRSRRVEGSIKGLGDWGTPCWDERGGKSQGEGSVERANQSAVRWERDQSWLLLGGSVAQSFSVSYISVLFTSLFPNRSFSDWITWSGLTHLPQSFPPPWFLIHRPPCLFTQSAPLRQIIIPSAVTKEMHTPSITMYKFSARGFGRVLIKKPFHSFSWEIIRLSSHQDATSIDPFSSSRKPIGDQINSRVFNHSPSGQQSIIKDIFLKKVCMSGKKRLQFWEKTS